MKKRISLIVNVIELYCIARREIKSSPETAGNDFDEFLEPEEIRVLYTFLRKIKTVIDKRHRYNWGNAGLGRLLRRIKQKNRYCSRIRAR